MPQENRIRKLPKTVADKIAAGEVVDRPLSVVKELLENSIDAEAASIVIEIKNGGKSYIRVTDDGCGISKEDLFLAFERHATSKIRTENDLFRIHSLGFRGEALASITAVSKVEIITKTVRSKVGSRLQLEGGILSEEGDTGCPDGTTIIVTDLFYNTPARLKFMKKDATESSLIIDFVSKMALAYPNIRIRMINNGSTLFSTQGKGSIPANLMTLYSREISERLIQISDRQGDYEIEAYLSPVDLSKINRKHQVYFINGRQINSHLLDQAVSEAYKERLSEGRYPVAYLFLNVAPERLDVNIHPNKREVRFDQNEEVKSFLVTALKHGLSTEQSFTTMSVKSSFRSPKLDSKPPQSHQVDIKTLLSTKRAEQANAEMDMAPLVIYEKNDPYEFPPNIEPELPRKELLPDIRILGALFGTYLMGTDDSNFYLIDQHAAHERVFYERLLSQFNSSDKLSQGILTPFVAEVSPANMDRSGEWTLTLEAMGYVLEEFGARSLIIKEIPGFMSLEEAKSFLLDFIDQIDESNTTISQKTLDKIIMNSCKSAIKGNDRLDEREIDQLLFDLAQTNNPFSCPHGRPTFIKLSKYEIERMFKRV